MARRNDHSKEELRRMTLDAVKSFLKEQPVQNMSLRKLAKQIGYAPASLLKVFGSYANLLQTANAEVLDELHALSCAAVRGEERPRTALRKLAQVHIAYVRKYPYRWLLAFEHRMPDNSPLPEWKESRVNRLFSLFAEQLSRAGRRDSLQSIHIASRVLWAGVHGICLLSVTGGLFREKYITGEQMLALFLDNFMNSHFSNESAASSTALAPG